VARGRPYVAARPLRIWSGLDGERCGPERSVLLGRTGHAMMDA
jgi:hypothetical protein